MTTKKLRLLFISTDRDIFREGSEVQERMRGYASIAETLTIIVFAKRSLHLKPVKLAENAWAHPTNSWFRWFYMWSALHLAKKLFTVLTEEGYAGAVEKVSLDLVSTQDPFECGLAGYWISKKLRVPLHLQIHTDFLNENFENGSRLNFIRKRIAKFLFREHATIRAVSERIKASVFKKMSFRGDAFPRIEVFPVWVDHDRFKNAEDTVLLHSQHPGFDLIVLVVARLEREKNVAEAIRIIAAAQRHNKEASIALVIVGDGSERKYLEKLSYELNVHDVVFFEGAVTDPAPYYKSADVLLVTSLYEGYGRQIAESAAAGCLVVTRDVGAAREILSHSNGIICEDNNADCLLHNVLLFAGNHVIRDQIKTGARIFAKRAVWETKEEYLERYRQILTKAVSNDEYLPFL